MQWNGHHGFVLFLNLMSRGPSFCFFPRAAVMLKVVSQGIQFANTDLYLSSWLWLLVLFWA
jgi:hypothetical protein